MSKEQLIDLDKKQLALLDEIIKRHIPYKAVWAYGSRVTWKANERSDLDLAVFECTSMEISNLKEDLEESHLLISVDVMDWEKIPQNFKDNIKNKYVVLQEKSLFPGGWREMRLGDVMSEIKSGGTPLTKHKEYYGGSIPWLTTKEINFNRIFDTKMKITEEGLQNSSAKWVNDNSVIIAMYGATAGKIAIAKIPLTTNQACCNLTINKNHTDYLYIYYNLFNRYRELINLCSGVAQQNLSIGLIADLKTLLPPLPEQKAIAEVLSSLDDKIDLLHRQNKTLEDTAQTLFRQWFIEEADEEWEEKPLDEVAEYLNGLACQKYPPENKIDKLPVLKIKELRNDFSENSDYSTSKVDEKYIVNLGDVIFSWSGSLMLKIWDGQKCILNQHLFKVASEKYPKWFYYFWTKHYLEKFIGIANSKATTMGHIKRDDLSNSMVLVPSNKKISEMDGALSPLLEKMIINFKEIDTVEKLRYTLLPNLMSGKTRVVIK